MKTILIASVAIGGLMIADASSAAPSRTEKGAAVGGVTGAVVGGPVGAVVGAGVGAVAGKATDKSGPAATTPRKHRKHRRHAASTTTTETTTTTPQ